MLPGQRRPAERHMPVFPLSRRGGGPGGRGNICGLQRGECFLGLTMCAERVAVFSAVAAGKRRIKGIVLLADGSEPPVPCGACRQVLYEFNPEMWIVCADLQGNRRVYSLPELLPEPFAAFSAEAQTT